MEKLEFEVKFFLSDIQSLRQDILDLGARSKGRFFEKNLRFEDANQTFTSALSNLLHRRVLQLFPKGILGRGH